MGETLK